MLWLKKYRKLFSEKTYFKVRSGTNGLKYIPDVYCVVLYVKVVNLPEKCFIINFIFFENLAISSGSVCWFSSANSFNFWVKTTVKVFLNSWSAVMVLTVYIFIILKITRCLYEKFLFLQCWLTNKILFFLLCTWPY